MKRGIFISLALIITISSYSQNSYYETSESISPAVKIINSKPDANFHICQVFEEGKIISYSPCEVKQYRLKEGREYFSGEIAVSDTLARIFPEYLTEGKSTHYYYLNRYKSYSFREKESTESYLIPENNGKENNTLEDFLAMIYADYPALTETAVSIINSL